MRAEIVGVGTELLLGQISNTNARWIGEHLSEIGVDVLYHQAVGDNLERIVEVMRLAASRADIVIVTGGLGPTQDDITRDALAVFLGVKMQPHPEIEAWLRERFAGFGSGPMPENNRRLAEVPAGARYIQPVRGSAPGLIADLPGGGRIYAVPGVPLEMVEMMEGTILPELAAMAGPGVIRSVTLRCTGIGESRVAEIVADLFERTANPSIAYLASNGEVKIRITAKAPSEAEATALASPLAAEVANRLGDVVFTRIDERLEEAVGRLLRGSGRTIALAESLTGGSVGARLTSVPGASNYMLGDAVVYSAEAKRSMLGVKEETLAGPGPVSRECALEMAAGARRLFSADIGLSLTGAAGPDPHGGAEPGTVWIGLATADIEHARGYVSAGERDRVRAWAEQAALDLVRRYLEGVSLPAGDRLI
ncbi:MAG: nicotinamide-nucleotide amidase [Actinomycetota bacterium]|nr:nicotinamide-nucleotide amidase [Actinomycetota bacterium]